MDEEMEDTYEFTFTAIEIDLDYEFDAARFFDFCREEPLVEAREAERWFDSAGSYPPSPFVARLVPRLDLLLGGHVNTSPKSKNGDDMNLSESDSDADENEGFSTMEAKHSYNDERDIEAFASVQESSIQKFHNQMQKIKSGLTFCNHMIKDNFKDKMKPSVKPSLSRGSTLMKPTASQMAKQIRAHQTGGLRFQKSFAEKKQKSSGNHSVIEVQAPKRQKLEGGQLCKVGDTVQQTDFVHKEPKKDGTVDANHMQTKLRITIPREPDLETTHRAQRARPKAGKEADDMTSNVPKFKARPLNKKIFEAPSLVLPKRSTPQLPKFQEFHLRTSERATQHISATSTSTAPNSNSDKVLHKFSTNSNAECGMREVSRPNLVDPAKQDSYESSRAFKALPLNKKIFTSKGDIGVFRNFKRETTVPREFNFRTEKRMHHNPPIELFNKLSLASDAQTRAGSQSKLPRPNCFALKGSKENRWGPGPFSEEQKIKEAPKDNLARAGGKHNQSSGDDGINRSGPPRWQSFVYR